MTAEEAKKIADDFNKLSGNKIIQPKERTAFDDLQDIVNGRK